MEGLNENVVELVFSVLGAAIFALVGFVWKISHKVNTLSSKVESMRGMNDRTCTELRKDIDLIYQNVDKNREWTTNRMMSIAKEMGS